MYEKLCAILDLLREEGFIVKAEWSRCGWRIFGFFPPLLLVVDYPLEYHELSRYNPKTAEDIVEEIKEGIC